MATAAKKSAPKALKAAAPAVKGRGSVRGAAISPTTKARSRAMLGLPPSLPVRRLTDVPGVYLNQDGVRIDEFGVALSMRQVKEAEVNHDHEVLGHEVRTPAELLKRVALDVTLSLGVRLDAAKAAAPYFDRKMPLALEGGDADKPLRTEQSVLIKNLNLLSAGDRRAALSLLEKLGVLGD